MLKRQIASILETSRAHGWVLEPLAKQILAAYDLSVPRSVWEKDLHRAQTAAEVLGFPLVAKVVSPAIMHKSDVCGVEVGVPGAAELAGAFERFSKLDGFDGILLEEMLTGVELIVGAKVDHAFGPVVLLGIGGTGVEIYNDVTIRMAPVDASEVDTMINCLRGKVLLDGFRGGRPVARAALAEMVAGFSHLVMDLQDTVESIDLNPVFCTEECCTVGDARILLKPPHGQSIPAVTR